MATPRQLSDTKSDGTLLGASSSDYIGFYGLATPIVQPSGATQAAVTVSTITTASQTTTPYGFATATQADNLTATVANTVTLVNKLRADLVALGLLKGSA